MASPTSSPSGRLFPPFYAGNGPTRMAEGADAMEMLVYSDGVHIMDEPLSSHNFCIGGMPCGAIPDPMAWTLSAEEDKHGLICAVLGNGNDISELGVDSDFNEVSAEGCSVS